MLHGFHLGNNPIEENITLGLYLESSYETPHTITAGEGDN